MEELIGVDLREPARAEVETLGGLVGALLDRMPRVGDEVLVAGRRVRVEQLQGRRIGVVRLLSGSLALDAETIPSGAG